MMNIFNYRQIEKLSGLKYPLLLDQIHIKNESNAVGIKNVSINESYFVGHFPGHKIMPGVLQLELLLQLASNALSFNMDTIGVNYIFKEIKKIRFKNPVLPGSQL